MARTLIAIACCAASAAAPASAQVPFLPTPTVPQVDKQPPPHARYHYVEVSDGVKIAVAVGLPRDYDPSRSYPAIFTMSGYANAVVTGSGRDYVNVSVSQRGTGCSGGEYELFTQRVARDGYEVIEEWLVKQPWSNGRVGITGHSFSGLDGFIVAATGPPHVKATAVSGLIEEFYRGISYPGGIGNVGFPALWTLSRSFPDDEQTGLEERGFRELEAGDPTCAANIASRPPNAPFVAEGAANPFDGPYWRQRSLAAMAGGVTAPIEILHSWQDNATGPSGAILWERIRPGTPKRLIASNGVHGTHRAFAAERQAWLDCWVLGDGQDCPPDLVDPAQRVQLHFETTGDPRAPVTNPALVAPDFPLPDTDWTRYYLAPDATLSTESPLQDGGADSYSAAPMDAGRTVGTQGATGAAEGLAYDHVFASPTAIAGPIAATLWLTSDAGDADFYVAIADVAPDGKVQYLQRGLLRASHRALDESASNRLTDGPHAGELFRPRHPHGAESLEPLVPGEPARLDVEVFPVGHVFRAGHALRVVVTTPENIDPVGGSSVYAAAAPGGEVTLLRDAEHPSSVLVPVLPGLPPVAAEAPACGDQLGVKCG